MGMTHLSFPNQDDSIWLMVALDQESKGLRSFCMAIIQNHECEDAPLHHVKSRCILTHAIGHVAKLGWGVMGHGEIMVSVWEIQEGRQGIYIDLGSQQGFFQALSLKS